MGGVYLSKPITKVEAEYGEDSNIAYITSSAQGWRTSMEGNINNSIILVMFNNLLIYL